MSIHDDEKDDKKEKRRPATKFTERPKPGQGKKSDLGDEQYWGQGRQQKERSAED